MAATLDWGGEMPGLQVNRTRALMRALCCGAALSTLSTAAALAQATPTREAPPAGGQGGTTLSEVVVTGTSIRGVAPAGAEIVGVKQEQIQATGAVTTNAILASVPQVVSQFNQLPEVGTQPVSQLQVSRPNLRDLPGSQSGNSTLLLVDGHRIASAGVVQFAPDADVVPPSLIERMEIVPDGGSSIYGTDAVGGVINFITKRRVDGVHVDIREGLANHYNQTNADILAGKSWDDASVYVAYDFQHNTMLYTRFRDYPRTIDWTTGIPLDRSCAQPNINIHNVNYAYPGLVPNSVNACDKTREGTLYPEQTRHSVYVGGSKDFGDRVKLDVRGFYTERSVRANNPGNLDSSVNVTPANPFYVNVPGAAGQPQNVAFNFMPVFGNAGLDQSKIKEWGVTPTISVDLGHDWEVRGLVNVGGSHSTFNTEGVNPTLLSQYAAGITAATALNPYNIAATNPALLANLTNFELAGDSKVNMENVRIVADGPLFTLPGGQVHLAAGMEYLRNHLSTRSTGSGMTPAEFAAAPFQDYTQAVRSLFGELQVPLVGPGNAMPGVQALNISASVRYDDYNDFGQTTNPRVGITWQPLDWITIRGSWDTSFNAPTPVDQLGSVSNFLSVFPFTINNPAVPPAGSNEWLIALQGSQKNLKPQTAEQWAVGADVKWPFLSGLRSSVTAYSIDYRGLLQRPPVFNPTVFFSSFPGFYVMNPSPAQISAIAAQAKGGAAQVAQFLQPNAPTVYELLYYVTANLGSAEAQGMDFSTEYRHATDFGGVDVRVGGNWEFKNQVTLGPGLPASDTLRGGDPRFRLSTTLGADFHQLRAELTLNHTASTRIIYSAVAQPADSIPAFNVVNLFFRYTLAGEDWRKNMFFTVNLDNIFNADPPVYKLNGSSGFINGSTLGRLVEFGAHKDF
jgi:iron complex outermembrane receptor protein